MSKPTLINIESGNSGYNLNLLEKIISLTGIPLSDLSNSSFEPNPDLREGLIEKHKRDSKFKILSKDPNIVYAVHYKLLPSQFITEYREVNEIRKFFKNFGWDFSGTSISTTLARIPTLIEIRKHQSKKNTNLYRKK